MIKSYLKKRAEFLIKVILFYFILSLNSYSDNLNGENRLIVLGSDSAKVKIKVFSSFTCPHCASFHMKILPKIKKEYIDNNKVQLIFIDFPLDAAALNASKLLHCVDEQNQINFMDAIYEKQSDWANASNLDEVNNNIKKIVKNLGITLDQFDQCLINVNIEDKILNGRIEASKKYSINSTPTIVINEKKLKDSVNFKNIKKKIEELI
jgi:protein-disulfide isomerase